MPATSMICCNILDFIFTFYAKIIQAAIIIYLFYYKMKYYKIYLYFKIINLLQNI